MWLTLALSAVTFEDFLERAGAWWSRLPPAIFMKNARPVYAITGQGGCAGGELWYLHKPRGNEKISRIGSEISPCISLGYIRLLSQDGVADLKSLFRGY